MDTIQVDVTEEVAVMAEVEDVRVAVEAITSPSDHTHTAEQITVDNDAFTYIDADNVQEAFESVDELLGVMTSGKQTVANMATDISAEVLPANNMYPSVYAVQQYVKAKLGVIENGNY